MSFRLVKQSKYSGCFFCFRPLLLVYQAHQRAAFGLVLMILKMIPYLNGNLQVMTDLNS